MKVLFIFLDGIGLGEDDPEINPLVIARLPTLEALLDGKRMVVSNTPLATRRATLMALEACLGVSGLPQSATGQATLLTGINVPARLGYHYGPKPNPSVAEIVREGTIFSKLKSAGKSATLLNAYPDSYFESISRGHRIFSVIPLAVTYAGIPLKTAQDLNQGRAISADFTGLGWRERLGLHDTPLLTPIQAGYRLAELAGELDFSFFEYWLSDFAGHYQDMQAACHLLETFDNVLEGLLQRWDEHDGLILITSDHGNMEDLTTRHHTSNPVPLLVIGEKGVRNKFNIALSDLSCIAPEVIAFVSAG
jgi:2,3-bisphosphoglycerate-independent phosphoglycerate mutase